MGFLTTELFQLVIHPHHFDARVMVKELIVTVFGHGQSYWLVRVYIVRVHTLKTVLTVKLDNVRTILKC